MEEKDSKIPNLESVKLQFEAWRAIRKGPRARIPDELWAAAKNLTKTHSINTVAKSLRLSYTDLKRKISKHNSQPTAKQHTSSFIELECHAPLRQSECIIEMEDSSGAKMIMCLRGDTNLDLLELGKAFWTKRS